MRRQTPRTFTQQPKIILTSANESFQKKEAVADGHNEDGRGEYAHSKEGFLDSIRFIIRMHIAAPSI
jgi:hypothetical protein